MAAWNLSVSFVYDYGQLYILDADRQWSPDSSEFEAALEDARMRRLSVGIAQGLVDLLMPTQCNFGASLHIEGANEAPSLDLDAWDHVVEFPLVISAGRLMLSASGGSGDEIVPVPRGVYRARWSGRNFAAAEASAGYTDQHNLKDACDEYRLELWPESEQQDPPVELKLWPSKRMRHTP